MGRLIDESVLLEAIEEIRLYNVTPGQPPFDMNRVRADELIQTIKAQPTAYDTEKVVEQLNDLPTFKMSATSEKHPFCAYEAEMISKHKVMGIVKKGGVE